MNSNRNLPSLGMALLAALALPVSASIAVVSNLGSSGEATASLLSSNGHLLSQSCVVRLASFPGKSAAEIVELAGDGVPALLAAASAFGEPSFVGDGGGQEGLIEFQAEASMLEALDGLHAIVTNANSSELLLLRLPVVIPADALSGPAAHVSVHLADATVVFGERTSAGLMTVPTPVSEPSTYEDWIVAELGTTSAESTRAPEADADQDGLENLLEYAIGSRAGDGSSRGQVLLRRAGSAFFLQYLRRTDDPTLSYQAEQATGPGMSSWVPLAGPVSAPDSDPSPAPEFFEWVEQPLPTGASVLARLKVESLAVEP